MEGSATSITIRQDDIDQAAERGRLLAKATGQKVVPLVDGARHEPRLLTREVQVIIMPEPKAQTQAT